MDNYFRQSPAVTADYNMMFSYILKLYETVLLNNKLLVEKITKMEYMEVIGKQEQEELQTIVKNKVTSLLGAKSVPYRLFAPAMYKLLWRQYRGKFHLDSYKNTPKFRYDEGVQYLKEWKPLKK